MPFYVPISNRDTVLRAHGYDISEELTVAIAYKSMDVGEEIRDGEAVKEEKGYTRIEIEGAYCFALLPNGNVRFTNVQMMDLKLSFVPPIVLNVLSKGALPIEFLNNLKKTIKKFKNSLWEERVYQKPELYDTLRDRLERAFEQTHHGKHNLSDLASLPEEDLEEPDEEEKDDDDYDDEDEEDIPPLNDTNVPYKAPLKGGDDENEDIQQETGTMMQTLVRKVSAFFLDEQSAEGFSTRAASFLGSFNPTGASTIKVNRKKKPNDDDDDDDNDMDGFLAKFPEDELKRKSGGKSLSKRLSGLISRKR